MLVQFDGKIYNRTINCSKPNYEQQKEHLAAFENLKAGKMSISDFKDFSNKLMYKIYELTNEEIRAIENLYN